MQNRRQRIHLGWLSLVFALVLVFPLWGAEPGLVKIDTSSPSLFFGNEPPRSDFDYKKWAGNRRLYHTQFSPAAWDEVAPLPKAPEEGDSLTLSRSYAENLLLRFQKPGSLRPRADQALIRGILDSNLVQESPFLVAGMMQNILNTSPSLYDKLIEDYPKLRKLSYKNELSNPFRTKAEETQLTESATRYVRAQVDRLLPDSQPLAETELKDWTNFRPLSPVLQNLSRGERIELEDQIMESIVFRANKESFKLSFPSLLFTAIEPAVEELFGDSPEVITHLEMVRDRNKLTPIIYGTQPLDGHSNKRNKYGFYSARLAPISLDDDAPKKRLKFHWKMNGRPFDATVQISQQGEDHIVIPKDSGPRYEEMAKSGSLSALVIFGTNIKSDVPGNLKAYLEFFKKKGFKRKGEVEKVSDLKDWFKEQVISGETSFIDKEAHAHGDLNNAIEVDDQAKIITLRKKPAKGPEQIVRIAYPYDDDSPSKKITNKEFGQWVRTRERENQTPLVFANLSCWSRDQADNQIPEFNSTLISEIISETMVDEFNGKRDNGGRILIESFLNRLNYAQTREKLSKYSEGYRNKTFDAFVFPDEERYAEMILQNRGPVRIRSKIIDRQTGKLYEADDLSEACWNILPKI